jgi:hypothetical protein
MIIEEKILDLAIVTLLQYQSGFMNFMDVVQDLPASPQPITTHWFARITIVQPEKYKKFVYASHPVIA